MKTYQEIELYLYFLKLEGNYCMARQLWKLAKHKSKKCTKQISNLIFNKDINYHVHRSTENSAN